MNDEPLLLPTSMRSIAARYLDVSFARSGGAGGQNVNKVETKVLLRLDLQAILEIFGERVHERVSKALANRTDRDGRVFVSCESTRSQHRNWSIARERLVTLIENAIKVPKKRRPTKPSRGAVRRRLQSKRQQSEKKKNRRGGDYE